MEATTRFWLATQRDPRNDWTATQNRVNYDVFAQAPFVAARRKNESLMILAGTVLFIAWVVINSQLLLKAGRVITWGRTGKVDTTCSSRRARVSDRTRYCHGMMPGDKPFLKPRWPQTGQRPLGI